MAYRLSLSVQRLSLWAAGVVALAPTWASAQAPGDLSATVDRTPISARRIVAHFDFDERALGNDGSVPRAWRPFRTDGFPAYLQGRFDESLGRSAAPSFRLDLDGGSVAYQYEGRDIGVRANSDYLIVAWVRTQGLDTARAYMTACFLDRKGHKLAGTELRSSLAGGVPQSDWQALAIGLHDPPENARYIGITLWLTQQAIWDSRPFPPHFIHREDIQATAWFDDVTVFRLPRVSLKTSNPGNVFGPAEPVEIRAEVADPDGLVLAAGLQIESADGRFRENRPVEIGAEGQGGTRVVYDRLAVGLYRVELKVETGEVPLTWRTLRLAKLPAPFSPPVAIGKGFGLILDDTAPELLPAQRELLRHLRTEAVKLPVWRAQQAAVAGLPPDTAPLDAYMEAIVDAGAEPVGVLVDDPSSAATGHLAAVQSMMDILSEDPLVWKPMIAHLWGRYAGLIHVWQVGRDDDEATAADYRLGNVIEHLATEMAGIMSNAHLATGHSLRRPAEPPGAADHRVVEVPAGVPLTDLAGCLEPVVASARPGHAWVTVRAHRADVYPREVRLAELARRMVEARFLGSGVVFASAPWETEAGVLGVSADPTEDYLVVRTVSDVLGAARPVSRMTLGAGARCLVFDRNGRALAFVWDEYAPPQGREHLLYLGEDAEQIDLWGNRVEMPPAGRHHRVRIGPMPTFIVNTPTWLLEFRREFAVSPALVEASFESESREIRFRNTFHEPISGLLRLLGPEGWDVRPSKFSFALQPGEEFRQTVAIRFPANAEAEVRSLVGDFSLDADRRYQIVTPAWFELGLADIDLDTFAYRHGDHAVIRVAMTNRTPSVLNFDAYVIAPGRQRSERLFAYVQSGQSVGKEFLLERAGELSGRDIRIGLRERTGTRMWNRVLRLP